MKTEILRMLRETDGYVSGQQISERFGVSRTAVWKVIRQLQEEGSQVEAVRNRGYHMAGSPDVMTKEELDSVIRTKWAGREVCYYDMTDSTNLRIRQAADEGAPHGTLAVADCQTAGRGRRGRSWDSPAGSSIYMSILLRPEIAPTRASMLTLVMACSVAEGISRSLEEQLDPSSGAEIPRIQINVRLGADKEGNIRGIDLYTLSNTGAFGEHGPTTVGLSGHKSIPLYGKAEAFRFTYDVVYTNVMSAGAYRGYGATQGIFAVESAVNELAQVLGMDPTVLREKNMVREGQVMPAYYGETAQSCALDRCLERAKEMIGWEEKYPCRDMGNGKVRGVGVAMAMQGSGISGVDTGSVAIKVNDDGFYSLMIGATDMGTGCDTILSQMAAECLDCDLEDIIVSGVDTDTSPYDCGSYASSTTYVTGMAVVKTCETLSRKICERGAEYLGCSPADVEFDGQKVTDLKTGESISRKEIGNRVMCSSNQPLSANEAFSSPTSPPPFMAGIAEVEIDKETGVVEMIDYAAVVDCGTVVNPNLARVQTEGGIAQGIGMALYEDIVYNSKGKNYSNSFMQYKIPSRLDVGNIRVEFESSYEPTGPFGAKSIGEIVINTPSPAISNAIQNAVGVIIRELPMTAEKVYRGMQK